MPNDSDALDPVFKALADPTRRAVLARLGRGPASTTELAEPFAMALPSFLQHLKVLEASGLVRSEKRGRVRRFELQIETLGRAERWIAGQRAHWDARLDRLDAFVLNQPQDAHSGDAADDDA